MKDKKKLFTQIFMILFLVMVVVGFTVPIAMNYFSTDPDQTSIQPRICASDRDCFLTCNDQQESVLCSQNLCQINSCQEKNPFPLTTNALEFDLQVNLNNQPQTLSVTSGTMFVNTYQSKTQLFTQNLDLTQVLEKYNIIVNDNCLTFNGNRYCSQENKLKVSINDQQSFSFDTYVPQSGDKIVIDIKD